jgi:hypothetical protein
MNNDNAVHCVGLMLGVHLTSITLMMEVGQGEKWNSSALVLTNPMDE